MHRFAITVSICAALASTPAFAASDTAPAPNDQAVVAAHDLLRAMDYRSVVDAIFSQHRKALPALLQTNIQAVIDADAGLNDEQKREALQRMGADAASTQALAATVFDDPSLVEAVTAHTATLYARHYTVGELRALAGFFRSPLGAKMLAVAPKLASDAQIVSQALVMPRVIAALAKLEKPATSTTGAAPALSDALATGSPPQQ